MNRDQLEEILRSNSVRDAEIILAKKVCWQPMETAPKDRDILVKEQGYVYIVHWGETWLGSRTGTTAGFGYRWLINLSDCDEIYSRVEAPEGWMEVPSA